MLLIIKKEDFQLELTKLEEERAYIGDRKRGRAANDRSMKVLEALGRKALRMKEEEIMRKATMYGIAESLKADDSYTLLRREAFLAGVRAILGIELKELQDAPVSSQEAHKSILQHEVV